VISGYAPACHRLTNDERHLPMWSHHCAQGEGWLCGSRRQRGDLCCRDAVRVAGVPASDVPGTLRSSCIEPCGSGGTALALYVEGECESLMGLRSHLRRRGLSVSVAVLLAMLAAGCSGALQARSADRPIDGTTTSSAPRSTTTSATTTASGLSTATSPSSSGTSAPARREARLEDCVRTFDTLAAVGGLEGSQALKTTLAQVDPRFAAEVELSDSVAAAAMHLQSGQQYEQALLLYAQPSWCRGLLRQGVPLPVSEVKAADPVAWQVRLSIPTSPERTDPAVEACIPLAQFWTRVVVSEAVGGSDNALGSFQFGTPAWVDMLDLIANSSYLQANMRSLVDNKGVRFTPSASAALGGLEVGVCESLVSVNAELPAGSGASGSGASGSSGVSGASGASGSLPKLMNGTLAEVKPTTVVLSNDGGNVVRQLKWSKWGKTAVGHGRWGYLSCNPNCAASTPVYYSAVLVASDVVEGHYTRLVEKLAGPHGGIETYNYEANGSGPPWLGANAANPSGDISGPSGVTANS